MRLLTALLLAFLIAAAFGRPTAIAAETCERLAKIALPDTTITLAQSVAAGAFTPPSNGPNPAQPLTSLPAFCRVAAVVAPSPDSHIEMEVWLPAENWNGKFEAVGNGGWAGVISYAAMAVGRPIAAAIRNANSRAVSKRIKTSPDALLYRL